MTIIAWGAETPAEVRAAVEPILDRYRHLIPGWCRSLHVTYRDTGSEEGNILTTGASPEYRHGWINILPAWLGETGESRERAIVHELIHLPLTPMVQMVEDLLTRLLDEGGAPQFHGFAQEQWRRAFEGAVQDLAYSIAGMTA